MDDKKNGTLEGFKKFSRDYVLYMQNLKTQVEGVGTFWMDTDYNILCSIYEEYSDTIEQISKAFFMFNEMFVIENGNTNGSVNSNTNNSGTEGA